MRRNLIIAWIVAGLVGVLWWSRHAATWRALELAQREVEQARLARTQQRWDEAEQRYEAALALLPSGASDVAPDERGIQVELLHARARNGQLFQSMASLEELLVATSRAGVEDPRIRAELATQSLYAAWLMRRNGLSRSRWQPLVETSRQNLQFLADHEAGGSPVATIARSNLDRVRRFELAPDAAIRNESFPDRDILKSRIPGELASDMSARPGGGNPPPSSMFGSAPSDGGGPPVNPPGGGW